MMANPLQMNDWNFKKFLGVVLTIQLTMWVMMGLGAIGVEVPLLRQLIGFIYLTFVPGVLILRILKLHRLGSIEMLLYTVGLSIAVLMFTGAFMNTVYPFFGISKPISSASLITTISIIVLALCSLCYVRDRDFSNLGYTPSINIRSALSPPALFLCLLPLISVLGAFYLVNSYQNSVVLMTLMVIIALIVLSVAFTKFIPKELYPLAVFTIGLSLLFHYSLISQYIIGWDVTTEYRNANLVMLNGYWEPKLTDNVSNMLSITMLIPGYSHISALETKWVIKVIYPLLYALVPLGLYRVAQRQTTDKIAFFSCFFFMAYYVFYMMPSSARLEIAEIFLVSLLLVILGSHTLGMDKKALLIIFAFSVVVSHYGYTYLFMLLLVVAYGILRLKAWRQKENMVANFTLGSVLLFIVFAFAWYAYVSGGPLRSIVLIGDRVVTDLFPQFASPEASHSLGIVMYETASPLHEAHKYLHLASQFFIGIGILMVLLKRRVLEIKDEYAAFSIGSFAICLMALVVPYFSGAMNTTRIYHFALVFLAPFFIIGGMTFLGILNKAFKSPLKHNLTTVSLGVLALFLATHLLFNTGFIYEVTKDNPSSRALSPYVDHISCNEREAAGVRWISSFYGSTRLVYGDKFSRQTLRALPVYTIVSSSFPSDIEQIQENSYIYLRTWNIERNEICFYEMRGQVAVLQHTSIDSIPELSHMLNTSSKIYDNGGSQIFVRR